MLLPFLSPDLFQVFFGRLILCPLFVHCSACLAMRSFLLLSSLIFSFEFALAQLPGQLSLQCLSTINVIFSDEDKILIKRSYLKRYTAKRLTDEFPQKSWTKHGVNKLLKKLRDTGTVDRATKRSHNNRLF